MRLPWWRGLARRLWLFLVSGNRPLEQDLIPLLPRGKGVRRMLARALWNERRERGAYIVRRYSRDPVVDRRERRLAYDEDLVARQRAPLQWRVRS